MVRADITAAAAQAAFAALCDEASCPRESFDNEEDFVSRLWPQSGQSESERLVLCVKYFVLAVSFDFVATY